MFHLSEANPGALPRAAHSGRNSKIESR